jgi:cell division protein FtsW
MSKPSSNMRRAPAASNASAKGVLPNMDFKLLAIIMVLLAAGLIMLSSASTVVSYNLSGNGSYYLLHQLLYGAIPGLILMYFASRIDYHIWQKYAPMLMFIVMAMLVFVLLPGIGFKVGNSRRWIDIGPLSIQPSELAKLVLIFYLASWIDKRQNKLHDFWYGLIPSLAIALVIAALIFKEPDIGTMLVVVLTSVTMLFVGGGSLKHLGWIVFGGIVILLIVVKIEPYRVQRFVAFLNPTTDPKGIGYQINQAAVAIGTGGWWGYGYGQSRQKHNYLPEVMGDSIFAVIVEELGFVRALIFPLLYGLFVYRGLHVAKSAPDVFGKMVAIGIIAWIGFQAMINIGAIIGILPLTGIPLPLVSYGSSALIVNLMAFGVLLNISRQARA